jgi:WRKY DNA -binding domain
MITFLNYRVEENSWTDNNTSMPYDDGYQWRKYGDKKISGSNFTRLVLFVLGLIHFFINPHLLIAPFSQKTKKKSTRTSIM